MLHIFLIFLFFPFPIVDGFSPSLWLQNVPKPVSRKTSWYVQIQKEYPNFNSSSTLNQNKPKILLGRQSHILHQNKLTFASSVTILLQDTFFRDYD